MKKLIFFNTFLLILLLTACNPVTTQETTTTSLPTTTDYTTIINDEIHIRLNGGIDTVEINSEWIDAGADLMINDAAHMMLTQDTVDVTKQGIYQIHYAYTHQEVVYEINRYVIVADQTPPILSLNLGLDTITVGQAWIDAGAEVVDNSGETITIITTGTVDINIIGTYVITYTATDSSDNTAVIYRYVTIID
jgi:hypothetical protein